jgi:enoyl-CoA hydratase/carnithine racemase
MTDSPVLYHKRDSIVTLTLNRPETLNAMNEAMMANLPLLMRPAIRSSPGNAWLPC